MCCANGEKKRRSETTAQFDACMENRDYRTALADKYQVAVEKWGVDSTPTFIVNGEGEVLFRFAGPLVGTDYEQRFVPALNAALSGS